MRGIASKVLEQLTVTIEPVRAADSEEHPDVARGVFGHTRDPVRRDRSWVVRIVTIDTYFVAVVPVEPVRGADPEEAARVLEDLVDPVVRQPLLDRDGLELRGDVALQHEAVAGSWLQHEQRDQHGPREAMSFQEQRRSSTYGLSRQVGSLYH